MSYSPYLNGILSENNNSTTPLLASDSFVGIAEQTDHPNLLVQVKTDQDGTLYVEFSPDGTNWDTSLSFSYHPERINPPHVFVKASRYIRIRFTNTTASNQTYFRLHTYFGEFNQLTAPINGVLAENYDATVVRPTNYSDEVAMGKRAGRTTWQKFGFNNDVDTGNDELIASWAGATSSTWDPTTQVITSAQTFTITYNNATDGLGQTGATQLLIYYLDSNYERQVGVHVLSNTGSDVTSFSGLGISRALVYANGGLGYNANDITITATTDGTTQSEIPAGKSVSQQLLFHTQIGHNFLCKQIRANCLRISGAGTQPVVTITLWSYSRVTNTKYQVFSQRLDTDVENSFDVNFNEPLVFGGREVIYMTATTTVNNTVVSGRFLGIEERIV